MSETVKAEVAVAICDNSEVLVGMADENFKKTMDAAKGNSTASTSRSRVWCGPCPKATRG